ncbi:MAG: PSD1 and planctomycete cytochrome C domain-containing protein, partial [Acidobacteria bacterium]|nr:PSD1 and planctomycete cytochrome C domain-containing protein [Acidobacteriota bacterium]
MRSALLSLVFATAALSQSTPDFERDIRPLLAANCLSCHNDKAKSSGLALTSRAALETGGNRGSALTWLPKALRHEDGLQMPPGRQLPTPDIAKIESWLAAGALWPTESTVRAPKRDHWAFHPLRPSSLPRIDHFLQARLQRESLLPSPPADRLTQLRRVSLDLTGLPPTPAEVQSFLVDPSPQAYETVVDRLLASPQYGERWARHWLDQSRYADSDGGSRDEPRPIWKYREWVINALNRNLPFDQFVVEQLAGDLLLNPTPEQLIATGFHRNSLLQIEAGTDREQYRVEAVTDRVDTTGTVLLGLSTGCARCHDHKFDPLTQKEYYQLFSLFNNLDEYGPDLPPFSSTSDLQITHAPLIAVGPPADAARHDALRAQLLALYKERLTYRGGDNSDLIKNDPGDKVRTETINTLKKQLSNLPLAMVMRERPVARPAHILLGGDYLRKGIPVSPGVPSWLHAPAGPINNRLDLARWITHKQNPLFARVAVNRIWQRYFGQGLVETENDFGSQGALPSHPELLDWLALQFINSGFDQNALHRLIVTPAACRQSPHLRPDLATKDPRNLLLARQSRLRLDAEIVRDSALAASGLLNSALGGPSVYPPQPAGVMETGQVVQSWPTSSGPDRYRRGLYTFHYRVTPNPSMQVFDAANGLAACTRRPRTNSPLQSLPLLNDPNFLEMAQALARRGAA